MHQPSRDGWEPDHTGSGSHPSQQPAAVLLASGNDQKLAELRRLIASAALDLKILGLGDVAAFSEPVEDGATYEITLRTGW